jgi:iron(III) transport system ATP-binding protein
VTAVFVTHDQDEAFLLGDEVAVMRDGLVAQQATPGELYARPATPWVASFVGDANLVPGTAAGDSATTALGTIALDRPAHGEVAVLVRPEDLALAAPSDDGVSVLVERREYYGHDTVYAIRVVEGPTARVRAAAAPRFRPGDAASLRYTGPPTVAFPPEAVAPPAAGDGPEGALPLPASTPDGADRRGVATSRA